MANPSRVLVLLVLNIHGLVCPNVHATECWGSPSQNETCRLLETATGIRADCRHLSLTEVPLGLPMDVTELDIGRNNILTLHNTSFRGLPRLKSLFTAFNGLKNIEAAAFSTLTNLQHLGLRYNSLSVLHNTLFHCIPLLQILDISHNIFLSIPVEPLQPLFDLRVLAAQYNSINSLDFSGIKSTTMSMVDLSMNNISVIEQNNFYPLKDTHISSMRLKGNNIRVLQDKVFVYLNNVTKLDLSSNKMQEMNFMWFMGMKKLDKLQLELNNISTIKPINNTFDHMTDKLSIRELCLYGNRLSKIPANVFTGLDTLQILDLHQSRVKTLLNESFLGLESLEKLVLNNNLISDFTAATFQVLPQLQTLQLSNNRLKHLRTLQFSGIKSLKTLQLALNNIQTLDTGVWSLPSLETLDMSRNKLFYLDRYYFNGLQKLKYLSLSGNPINTIRNYAFHGLENLRQLDVSALGKLGSFTNPFANLGQLETLTLTGTLLHPDFDTFTGLGSLQKLTLKDATLQSDELWDSKKNVSVFAELPQLKFLLLGGNFLNDMHPDTFVNLQALRNLALDNCDITYLHQNIFNNLTSLIYLFLQNNQLKTISQKHFITLRSLVGLKLQHNEIAHIDTNLLSINKRLSYLYIANNALSIISKGTALPKHFLDISGNPVSCVCDLEWFRQWIDRSNVTLRKPNQTICSLTSQAALQGKPLLTFDPTYACAPNVTLYASAVLAGTAFLLGTVMAYNRRWWLRYKLFHLKLLFIGYDEIQDGRNHTDFRYDINIIFDDNDAEWVEQVLKPGIEERMPDFNRFVCGDDDLPLAMYYMDAVIHVIENSFKTILVVSEAAATSHNFISKLRHVVEHMNEEEVDNALLVFVKELPTKNLPYLVRLFLSQNKPYISWNEDQHGQQLFWEKLIKTVSTNKKMNDFLPI